MEPDKANVPAAVRCGRCNRRYVYLHDGFPVVSASAEKPMGIDAIVDSGPESW